MTNSTSSQEIIASSSDMEEGKKVMVEILDEFVRICERHDLNYWLDSGTLLGAYRHGGFIPWDDDIDVGMPREHYERFLKVAVNELGDDYFLQTAQTDKGYFYKSVPCKIRKNNTIYIEKIDVENNFPYQGANCGIYIDVFPFDLYVERSVADLFFRKLFSKIYLAYKLSRVKSRFPFGLKKIVLYLFSFFPGRAFECSLKILVKKSMALSPARHDVYYAHGYELPFFGAKMKHADLYPLEKIEFEGKEYFSPNNVTKYLAMHYGESFMTIPPESKRVSHAYFIGVNTASGC